MRLDEIREGMRVWIISCYGGKRQLATVVGIRHICVNNRRLRYVALSVKRRGIKRYYTDRWARDLRKTAN